MDPIEKGLRGEIPLEAAADFFIKLKYGSAQNLEAQKLAALQAKMKEKASGMDLPPTAMGMNMPAAQPQKLPDSGMGKHAEEEKEAFKQPYWVAKKYQGGTPRKAKGLARVGELVTGGRAKKLEESLEKKHDKLRALNKRRDGRGTTRLTEPYKRTSGPVQHTRNELGKERLKVTATRTAGGAVAAAGAMGAANVERIPKDERSGKKEKKASSHEERFKLAMDAMFGEGMTAPGSVAPHVDMSQYMAMEQEGEEAEEMAQSDFLRSKLEAANAELQAARDEAMQAQQTMQQLQMGQSQHEQQLQAAQQQAQLATQAAMQNVQQAHQLAMQATSQALQAKDDSINTHSLAAKMRMAYQDLRGSIMDAVAQDAAAPVGEAIKAQGALAAAPAAPMGGDPAMGEDPNAPPPPDGAPADQAAGAEAPPGATPAEGAPQAAAEPPGPPVAEAGASGEVGPPKTAGIGGDMFGAAMGHLKDKAPYALAGAALGGGLTAIESRVGHQGLRGRIQHMEASPEGGFGKALRLASAKARLAVGEAVEKHPVAGTLAGAAMGASAGMSLGPGIMEGFRLLPGRLKELQGK